MKRVFLIVLALMFVAMPVYAGPFFVVDDDPEVTSYRVKINGELYDDFPAPLRVDLDGLENGTYELEVQAINIWGISSVLPFVFTKKLPNVPSGGRLEE